MSLDLFTDSGQAEAACREAFADKFIHVTGLGWLTYTGSHWREVEDKVPLAALRVWATARLGAVAAKGGDVKPWAKRLDTPKLRNALTLAEGFDGISVEPDQLDANPDVLNCRNGVVYLPTGDLVPHDPRHYFTKCTNVEYDPAAEHADWSAAIAAIPESVRPWLQARFGQGITGHACPDDRMVIMQGGGGNGKSTVTAGIAGALGGYYHQAPSRLLMSSQSGGHSADLADLRGTRFVAIEETPEAGRLDVVLLKTVAGTPRVSARKLYKDPVSFPATHTLFLNTNYTPVVGETDEGTWRRLLLVVFPFTFADDPIDELELPKDGLLRARVEKGAEQHRAALAWLVAGAKAWYEGARMFGPTPQMVVSDTDEWRDRTDSVVTFWNDYLDVAPGHYVWTGDLTWYYNQYMRNRGNSGVADQTFWRRFATHALTTGADVHKKRLKNAAGQTRTMSRPGGGGDPFARLPGVPEGAIWAWVGLKFRPMTDGPSYRDLAAWDAAGSTGSTA